MKCTGWLGEGHHLNGMKPAGYPEPVRLHQDEEAPNTSHHGRCFKVQLMLRAHDPLSWPST
jgi:hypothetical protein